MISLKLFNLTLFPIVVGLVIGVLLLQRSRKGLSPEQLYTLEKNADTLRQFLLIAIPGGIGLAIVELIPVYEMWTTLITVSLVVGLVIFQAAFQKRKLAALGLPPAYLTTYLISIVIMMVGFVVGFSVLVMANLGLITR